MRVGKSFAYYNEIDPYAAQWLRNLIDAGHIAPGVVDERSIEEVQADELREFTQCHFFAGIGGWSLAARLAGWADDEPLWTGSCPCQPFSAAGKRAGTDDERHLWPVFFRLIKECRPSAVAGEQVASRLGYEWLAGIRSDLESEAYAVGAVDLCAASVGAPHIRQRMWWVADAGRERDERGSGLGEAQSSDRQAKRKADQWEWSRSDLRGGGSGSRMADASNGGRAWEESERWETRREPDRSSCRLGDADHEGSQGHGRLERLDDSQGRQGAFRRSWSSSVDSWQATLIPCADGKARRIKPSIEPLAHGIPGRVGRLRAYGNAIVPQVAAEVLKAWRF
jgi:DNA (cytosine-5)-methyltransferase 1